MDPVSVLGLASSMVAIFDGLKEAYRFGREVILADNDRKDFNSRLEYVETVMMSVTTLIEAEKAHPGQAWLLLLNPDDNTKSPLKGLELAVKSMNTALMDKKTAWRQKLRNFEWPSEKKKLESYFTSVDGFCAGIVTILTTAGIGLQRENLTLSKEINVTGQILAMKLEETREETKEINLTTQVLAAKFGEGQEETREINLTTKALAAKFDETREETREIKLITKTLAAKFEEDRAETKKIREKAERLQAENRQRQEGLEKKDIENWLSPFDFQAQQREKLEDAAPSGKLFLESPEFRNWKSGDVQHLRCYGPSGAGKTILSAIVLEHLTQELSHKTPVLCVFFEQKPSFPQTLNNLLGSLLKQLIQAKEGGVPSRVKETYLKATRINAKLTQQEMKSLLKAELELYDNVFIVVDALDEAPEVSRSFVDKHLRPLYPDRLKLMTTRREDTELSRGKVLCNVCYSECVFWYHCNECPQADEERMDLCQSCRDGETRCPANSMHTFSVPKTVEKVISTSNDDLEVYVGSVIKAQMPEDLSDDDPSPPRGTSPKLGWMCYQNPSLLEDIVKVVANASKGRFLLAKQYTRSLSSKRTLGAIKRAIEKIQGDQYSLSEVIDKNYDDDMAMRIKGQDSESLKLALRILSIVSTARRNLRLVELQHALAAAEEETTTKFDPDDQLDRQDILDLTKGLIRIDRDRQATVRLDHRTLVEYFEKTRSKHFPDCEVNMTRICLKYLNFDEFSKPCDKVEEFAAKEQSYVFISYAVQYWGDHLRESTCRESSHADIIKAAATYLQTTPRLEAYIQVAWWSTTLENEKWDVRRTIHPLHVCAWFDLDYLISALDYQNMDLDVHETTFGQTPLMYACRRGSGRIARRLMELGASVNLVSSRGRTALFEAVLAKNDEIVKLLLSPEFGILGLDVNMKNDKLWGRTALMVAAHQGQNNTVDELLKHHEVSINVQDTEGNTAISLASAEGHLVVVTALLRMGNIELNTKENKFGRTALSSAAEAGHPDIVELLLTHGAQAELSDMRGGTPVLRAAEEGKSGAVEKLVGFGVNLGHTDEDGCTPLHWACKNGHLDVLQILLEHCNMMGAQDKNGMTPFHYACQSGELETVQFLLERGADSTMKDNFERTPFVVAWQYGHDDLMKLLCIPEKTNGMPGSANTLPTQDLPFWSLVIQRKLEHLESAAASNQAYITVREPGTENTALHLALIPRGNDDQDSISVRLLQTLLPHAKGSLDTPDDCGRSPIHLAALYENVNAARFLLEYEPQLNEKDRFGLTPLAIAFTNGCFTIATMLIAAGADIQSSNIDVQKMLFKAIELQNVVAVELLVDAGASATTPDEYGRTVNQLAQLSGISRLMHKVQAIKSSKWQLNRAGTVKANTHVEMDEIVNEVTTDIVPTVSKLSIRDTKAVAGKIEVTALCIE